MSSSFDFDRATCFCDLLGVLTTFAGSDRTQQLREALSSLISDVPNPRLIKDCFTLSLQHDAAM